jgi:hypothetical protein
MKIFIIFALVLIQNFSSFADAGLAFRYKVELQNKNETITGYVYHYTYSSGYNDEKESFCDYFTRDFNNTPYLYKEVHSLNLFENLEIDFFLPKNRLKFSLKNITNVKLLEEIEFTVGQKVFLIENENVYNLIGKTSFNIDGIYYPWMENCSFHIIDFNKVKSFEKVKKNLDSLITKHFNTDLQVVDEEFYEIFYKEKEKMLKEKVLIFQYCDQL